MSDIEIVRYHRGRSDWRDAATYDERRYRGPANAYKQAVMAAAYTRLLGSVRGRRVLDVGCGTGRGALDLASQGARVVGLDASPDMLAIARARRRSGQRCALVAGYSQHLPFPDASFDVVIALNFLHLFSLESQRDMLREMTRVLRPGGVLLVEFDNALHGLAVGLCKRWCGVERGMLPAEIRRVLGTGCRVERIHGAVFPVVWRFLHRAPALGALIEKAAYVTPVNRLAHRIYYRLRKHGVPRRG